MELDRGVTIHHGVANASQAVHLRAWPRIGVLVNGLRKLFDQDLERELEEPGFGGASWVLFRPLPVLTCSLPASDRSGQCCGTDDARAPLARW